MVELAVLSQALRQEQWDWKVILGMGVVWVVGLVLVTSLATSLKSTILLWQKGDAKTPPIAPYNIPVAGNLVQFAFNTHNFLSSLMQNFGKNVAVRFRVLNLKLYLVSGPEMVQSLFRASKELTTVPSTILVLENSFGWPSKLTHILTRDQTGIYATPNPKAPPMDSHNRIFHHIHSSLHNHLSGSALNELAPRFMEYLSEELNGLDITEEWKEIPDLYTLIQTSAFKASMNAVCGPHFLRLNPDFAETFWEFDSWIMYMFKNLPRWLVPKAYAVRDDAKRQVAKWHEFAKSQLDPADESLAKVEWEEYYGSRLMRERQAFSAGVDDLTDDAIAANDLGMLWGANANIIPMIGWELMDTIKRPDVLARCRAEVEKAVDPSSSAPLHIQLSELMKQPLLQSVYAEELRIRNGVIIQRVPLVENFQMSGYKFPKGNMIVASSWHEGRDKNIWNQGPNNEHSVEEFWAERFLVYPNDPTSGPRKPGTETKRSNAKIESASENNEPKFAADSVLGSFIPYGGGAKVCPGRFYAKHEALIGLALFIMMFDIEMLENKEIKPNMNYFPFGVVPPLGKFPARMRRRKV